MRSANHVGHRCVGFKALGFAPVGPEGAGSPGQILLHPELTLSAIA
jgi:hypothetical protein